MTTTKPRRTRKAAPDGAPAAPANAGLPPGAAPPPPPAVATGSSPDAPQGKLGILVGLLCRPEGARIAELVEATGWLTHSVRGAMSGALKGRGYAITSTPDAEGRIYRVTSAAAQ